jgi:hypothetical protein
MTLRGLLFAHSTHAVYETAMTYIPCSGNSLASDLFTCLVQSSSASKCWEFVSRKNPALISKNFVRLDQGEAAFPLGKANVEATGLLRLSGASLISVV